MTTKLRRLFAFMALPIVGKGFALFARMESFSMRLQKRRVARPI